MFNKWISLAAAGLVLVYGCGEHTGSSSVSPEPESPPVTASTLGEQLVLATDEYLLQPPYASADRTNGERQVAICRACHSLERDGAHMIGPNLHGFFGKKAGTRTGFDYSEAVVEAEFFWTPAALDAWLSEPGQFLPGNRMTFAGVYDAGDRADLIAYLLKATEGE